MKRHCNNPKIQPIQKILVKKKGVPYLTPERHVMLNQSQYYRDNQLNPGRVSHLPHLFSWLFKIIKVAITEYLYDAQL